MLQLASASQKNLAEYTRGSVFWLILVLDGVFKGKLKSNGESERTEAEVNDSDRSGNIQSKCCLLQKDANVLW